jgi:hypothetical protein
MEKVKPIVLRHINQFQRPTHSLGYGSCVKDAAVRSASSQSNISHLKVALLKPVGNSDSRAVRRRVL